MSQTTTYVRTSDGVTEETVITIDGDEAVFTYLTDDVQTASEVREADSPLVQQRINQLLADGYVVQS